MKAIISHYDIKISKLKENIQVTLNDLSTITTPDHYDFLLRGQESFTKKNSKKLLKGRYSIKLKVHIWVVQCQSISQIYLWDNLKQIC